jgi:hypothetical protein
MDLAKRQRKVQIGYMRWTLQFWDVMVVIAAIAVGFGVWLMPSFTSTKDYKDMVAGQKRIIAAREARQAEAARVKAEREALGLVFISPATPAQTPSQQPSPPPPTR